VRLKGATGAWAAEAELVAKAELVAEVEPMAEAEAPAEVQEIRLTPGTVTPPTEVADKQHDAVLSTLLVEHN
jgi:hypothetical protein